MSTPPIAVLISGGLDSAILLGEMLRAGQPAFPLYIQCRLHYEDVELQWLRRYLAALQSPALRPLTVLSMPVADLYGDHWSITGRGVPSEHMPDETVFLPGRNILLLSKAMIWCHLHNVPAVALGSLQSNPFPDATPEFFAGFEALVNKAVGSVVKIKLPFAGMKKTAVMQRGRDLPLDMTFSCIQPRDGLHCGQCNKCAE